MSGSWHNCSIFVFGILPVLPTKLTIFFHGRFFFSVMFQKHCRARETWFEMDGAKMMRGGGGPWMDGWRNITTSDRMEEKLLFP